MASKYNENLPIAERSPAVPNQAANAVQQFAASSFDALCVNSVANVGVTTATFDPQTGFTLSLFLFTQGFPTRLGGVISQIYGAAGPPDVGGYQTFPGAGLAIAPSLTAAEWAAFGCGAATVAGATAYGERQTITTGTNAAPATGYGFEGTAAANANSGITTGQCVVSVETPGQGFGYPLIGGSVNTGALQCVILDEADFSTAVQEGNTTQPLSAGAPYLINMTGGGTALVVGIYTLA